MALLIAAGVVLAGGYARATDAVAVLGLRFEGDLTDALHGMLDARFAAGLRASGATVSTGTVVRRALAGRGEGCGDPTCIRELAAKLACRFVAGGRVRGEDRSYDLELWLADGRTGEVVARVRQSCEICGQQALADKMDLAASALRAKAKASSQAPGRVLVKSEPPGALIRVDGQPVGRTPQELELSAGAHKIEAEASGYAPARRSVTVVAGVQERLEVALVPASSGNRALRAWGWGTLAAGVAAVGVGSILAAFNGMGKDCQTSTTVPGEQCPRQVSTAVPGWILVGTGAALSVTGIVLVVRARRFACADGATCASARLSPPKATVSLVPGPAGLALVGSF
ncbi:MAG: PEGA domain-containing protein [Deltaproteobacteria bacterium]|nr:PEGA domain-containing protein [Deltaproteobacteria bacterium]